MSRAGAARQEGVLLLLGAEQLQRLRYADRLVRGEQRADGRAGGADQGERLVVVDLGEAEAAVLGVDLHAERAELLEPVDRPRRGSGPRARSARRRSSSRRSRAAWRGTPRRARTSSSGGIGWGWIRSSRKRPRNSSLAKLGLRQSCSRAASATWRASRSVTAGFLGGADMRGSPRRESGSSEQFGYWPVLLDRMYPITGDPTSPRAPPRRDAPLPSEPGFQPMSQQLVPYECLGEVVEIAGGLACPVPVEPHHRSRRWTGPASRAPPDRLTHDNPPPAHKPHPPPP